MLSYAPPYCFVHYPEGLKGRYVASPSVAAHLGKGRIFSSRSEYIYQVSVDRKRRRRRRAWEVVSRAAELQGLQAVPSLEDDDEDDDLEDAARFRYRVWSGVDRAGVRSATPRFLVNIHRPRCRPRPTWSAVRLCVRTEEESAEAISRIAHWQSTSALTVDRELSYPSVVEAEADSDIGSKVEPDQLDLFASPPPRSASPDVQILSRWASFFADTPLPSSQLVATASDVHVRIEREEPQLSRLASASPLLCQVVRPQVQPSYQPPVVTLPQWHAAPQNGPMPPPVAPLWVRAAQDVIMGEASADDLRSQVVESLYHQPGPAFSSFSAFAAATTAPPQVLLDVPMSPPVPIESHSEEVLPGWRRWREVRPPPGPCVTPVRTAAVPRSPQPPATPESLFGGDDSDDEDDCIIITCTKPAPGPTSEKAPEATQAQVNHEPAEDFDPLFDEAPSEDEQPMECAPTVAVPQTHAVSAAPAPFVAQPPPMGPLPSPPIRDVEMGSSDSGVQHTRLPHVRSVIRPLHVPVPVHDVTMAAAQPPVGEARSPRIADVEMGGDVSLRAVQVRQQRPCPSRKAVVPLRPETTETSLASTDDGNDKEQKEQKEQEQEKDSEDAVLLRELLAMRRDPNEWFPQSSLPAPTVAVAKTKPTASDAAALALARVESAPSIVALDLSPAPAVFGLVKVASVTFALADLTLLSDVSEVDGEDDDEDDDEDEGLSYGPSGSDWSMPGSTSEDADICSLAESFAKLSVGSAPEALSSLPLEASDSVVSYLDVEDRADVPSPESPAPVAESSDAVPPVKVEEAEVPPSTPVLASNATAVGLSPYKRIISNIECEEEVHVPQTGQQSALLLRPSTEASRCPLDNEPDCEVSRPSLSHPGHTSSPSGEHGAIDPPSTVPASEPPVHGSSQDKTPPTLHTHEEDTSASKEKAIEDRKALPPLDVRNAPAQVTANALVGPRSVRTNSVLPSRLRYTFAPSRRPRTDDKSNTADAAQGSGAPSSSSRRVSWDLGGPRKVYKGRSPLPAVVPSSAHKLDYSERSSMGTPAPSTGNKSGRAGSGLALATASGSDEDKDDSKRKDTVLACSAGSAAPALARVSTGSTGSGNTLRTGNNDGSNNSRRRPSPPSGKGKVRFLLDSPADDRQNGNLGINAVPPVPAVFRLSIVSAPSSSSAFTVSSPRAPVRPCLRKPRHLAPPPARSSTPTPAPRPPTARPSLSSRAVSFLRRCLGLKAS
ncbi:hypothetical protein V8D89_007660 [Ganoderma adspersum]